MGKFNVIGIIFIRKSDDTRPAGIRHARSINDTVYILFGDHIKAFGLTALSQSGATFGGRAVTPSVSSNDSTNGIVWVLENVAVGLHRADDATNLAKGLHNSNEAAARDQFGQGNKDVTSMCANGRVYVGRATAAVFGVRR
jgi:hypothetical protein